MKQDWHKGFIALLAVLVFAGVAFAEPKRRETDISKQWCEVYGGEAEKRTIAGDRVDCYIKDPFGGGMAVEVEWARKWHEAIGQALSYRYQMQDEHGYQVEAGIVIVREPDLSDSLFNKRMGELKRILGYHPWLRLTCIEQDLKFIACGD